MQLKLITYILIFFIGFSGCGTKKQFIYLADNLSTLPNKKIVTGSLDAGNFNFPYDVHSYYREHMNEALVAAGLASSQGEDSLTLNTTIVEYVAGDLGERWLSSGMSGAAYAELYIDVMENDNRIGVVHVQEDIHDGGLYTAGAEKRILGRAIESAVHVIKKNKKSDGPIPSIHDLIIRPNRSAFRGVKNPDRFTNGASRNLPKTEEFCLLQVDSMMRGAKSPVDFQLQRIEKLGEYLESGCISREKFLEKKESILNTKS